MRERLTRRRPAVACRLIAGRETERENARRLLHIHTHSECERERERERER